MRKVYLIRHGHPDFPVGAHMCLGRTDLPLGPLGRMQACLLAEELREKEPFSCFASPLIRAKQTAEPLLLPIDTIDGLAEQNMGTWDGLDFDTIERIDPDLHRARRTNPLLVPAGAETLAQVQQRAMSALRQCAGSCRGDFAVFAHASVIQAILAYVMGVALAESRELRPPYVGYSVMEYDGGFHMLSRENVPHPEMTPMLAESLLAAAAPGARVEAHCRAVARKAMEIAEALPLPMDRNALCCAALLHDVARSEKNHAEAGALWVKTLGYEKEAEIIRQHHDLASDTVDEAAILYISDKCIQETEPVSIEERFAKSAAKCVGREAQEAHERRYQKALALQNQINSLCKQAIL